MSGKGFLDFDSFWAFLFHFVMAILYFLSAENTKSPRRQKIQNRHNKMKQKRPKRIEIQEPFSRHKFVKNQIEIWQNIQCELIMLLDLDRNPFAPPN